MQPQTSPITRAQFLRHLCGGAAGLWAMGATPAAASGPAAPRPGAPSGDHPPGGRATLVHREIELRLHHAWTLSRNTSQVKRNHLVELHCDGVTGLGEAAPNVRFGESPESVAAAMPVAAEIVASVHPSHRLELQRRLAERLPHAHAVRCAVDMAAWDWNARALGVPVSRLIGLSGSEPIPLTSFSLGIAPHDELVQKVREAAPYPLLKVKLGGHGGPDRDHEIVGTICEAAPDKLLRVDPNEGWTPAEARAKLAWLASLRRPDGKPAIELCEQPLPAADPAALFALYRERPPGLPLLLDESVLGDADIPPLRGACDGVVIKLQKAGGLTPALAQITVARALGMKVMLGCMIETSLGITAAAHLAALCDYVDLDGHLLIANDPFRGVQVHAGALRLPGGPGLGVSA